MGYKSKGGQTGKKDMAIALLQIHSKMKDVEANLKEIVNRVKEAGDQGANLIVAPELALTGGLFKLEDCHMVAQTIPGPTTEEVGAAAKKANAYVVFGMAEKSEKDLYNSVAVMSPNGNLVARYRKTHLWSFEHQIFKLGEEPCLIETEFGTVGVTICYDACFPEFIRALATMGATVITHSTFWLTHESFDKYGYDTGIYHSYCRTRAFENQVYFASANRVGNDEYLYGLGNSCIMTPWGTIAGKLGHAPGILVMKTEWERLAAWQEMEPHWPDRRPEFYKRIMDFC
jgi:predicted amidohydrolase